MMKKNKLYLVARVFFDHIINLEVNLEHVLNRIFDQDIKVLVKNAWKDLEIIAGQEIRLLENNCKKNFINRLYKKLKM